MKTRNKAYWLIIAALFVGVMLFQRPANDDGNRQATGVVNTDAVVERLYREQASNVFVTVSGQVVRILPDDEEGARHQRFILQLDSGRTLLVSHNIDLAPRIDSLQESTRATVRGEYEWNRKGGVMHWTHRDPRGQVPGGWIEYKGVRYH